MPKKTLFRAVVEKRKQHRSYKALRSSAASLPARWMLDVIYATFEDSDGNFLEQFQTTGFDTRYFELYLHAYFSRSGYRIERPKPSPDFIVERDGLRVAVEATTVNPAKAGTIAAEGKAISDLDEAGLNEYMRNELAIRFGSPLFSKLKKRYWESKACKDLPFVIAIEAFHDDESLMFSDAALARYVFGVDQLTGNWDASGMLTVSTSHVSEHKVGAKTIPSSFFAQPDAENISAILFTNSGTNAKFGRMGYQHGAGNETISVRRSGFAYSP